MKQIIEAVTQNPALATVIAIAVVALIISAFLLYNFHRAASDLIDSTINDDSNGEGVGNKSFSPHGSSFHRQRR